MLSYQQPENIRTISDSPHPVCPSCDSEKGYTLADGRVKCAACRKVFTPVYKTGRLDQEQLSTLAKSFWEMRSATETAEQLNLNIKTVQRYFHQLRANIELHCTQLAVKQYGITTISESVFKEQQSRARLGSTAKPIAAIMASATTLAILPSGPASPGLATDVCNLQPNGWLYAKDHESLQRSQIDHIHCLASDSDYISLIQPFWQYAKIGLNRYQGGFRHHFPLFLREMEFRYNYRDNPNGAKLCLDLLTDSTN
jgi:transposase